MDGGRLDFCRAAEEDFSCVINKKHADKVEKSIEIIDALKAPVAKGGQVGTVTYRANGEILGMAKIVTCESVDSIRFLDILIRMLARICLC